MVKSVCIRPKTLHRTRFEEMMDLVKSPSTKIIAVSGDKQIDLTALLNENEVKNTYGKLIEKSE